MTRLQLLFLVALPLCAAQFSIQGPSDGNRRAQGLKYDSQKGIQYDEQAASLGTGDFSIQGATDGNSNFQIQGASDGNSDFQIHGATDGNANFVIRGATDSNADFQIQGASDGNANFQIQGATDGNANFQIQGATDGHSQNPPQNRYYENQGRREETGRALQYQDPSGSKVNWNSYQHAARSQAQPEPQSNINYAPAPAAPRRKAPRKQQAQHQAQQIPEPAQQNFKVYDKAPPSIQQILQFQQQIPYMNSIPQQFRYDFQNAPIAVEQAQEAPIEEQKPLRNNQRGKPRGSARQKRQAQRKQQQRQKIAQQPSEPQPQLSTSVPSRIQGILEFQSKIPYINHIPEQWRYEALLKQQGDLPQPQYQRQPEAEPVRHSQRVRQKRQAQKQYQEPQPHYKENLPAHLQQLLKFQSQTPYTSVIPEQFSYEKLAAAQGHRQKRQAPRYQHNQQNRQDQSQLDLSQYQRIAQPQAQTLPKYSTQLPGSIKQILQFQSQTPYDIVANTISYRLEKPYVPQPIVPAPISQNPQPQKPVFNPSQQLAPNSQYPQPQQPTYQPAPITQPQYQPAKPQYQAPQPLSYQPQNLPQYPQPQRPIYQPAQAQYPQLPQPQYQQPQLPQIPNAQYQQPQLPLLPKPQYPQPQYQQPQQAPVYQSPNLARPQYQSNQAPQSQLIRNPLHPNAVSQYSQSPYPSPYGQTTPVRPVTENQY